MKFTKIWEKLGNQTIKNLNKEAYVFIGNEKYKIANIKYENGKPIGFEILENLWNNASNKPDEHKWIIVRDKDGKEYNNHQWNGMCWYSFVKNRDGSCDGWRSDIEVVSWRYE